LPCTLTYSGGETHVTTLPDAIDPDQPPAGFTDLTGLAHALPGGGEVAFTFSGEAFELEDQRNWTDASFKTFCTPLALPFPVEIKKGGRVKQRVEMQVAGPPITAWGGGDSGITLSLLNAPALPFPALGLGVPNELPLPDAVGLARLKALGLAHLRVDNFESNGLALAAALGLPVELALHGTGYAGRAGNWARVLTLPETEHSKKQPDHGALLQAARAAFPGAAVFLGTDADFLFLNRFTPGDDADGFTFAITPQMHAFDDASIIETAEAQGVAVDSARRLAGERPVIVSPVTLLPRWNPYAATPQPRGVPAADPRQSTPFCAAWTLTSLKYLAEAGAVSITLYETHGARGVLDTPVESLLVQLAGASRVLPSRSSDPLRVEILAFERGGERVVLAANLTDQPQEVKWGMTSRKLEAYTIARF
jgi:D-apionolactonase